MVENFIDEIRKIPSLGTAIIKSVTLVKESGSVEVDIITDKTYTAEDEAAAKRAVRKFTPELFSCALKISKLTPDEDMVARKILSIIGENRRGQPAGKVPHPLLQWGHSPDPPGEKEQAGGYRHRGRARKYPI